MDDVFKAINDPSRRLLLDLLFERDGRALGELTEHLPQMTRFGVMSHLSVLEEAGLITTRKDGRRKLHYLNPVPIRLIHDRWISKYTEHVVGRMAALTNRGGRMTTPAHVYVTYISAPAEEVWRAITDGDSTVQYYYGTRVESSWESGAELKYTYADGTVAADGEVLSIDPPKRLEHTFHPRWDPELEAEGPVREAWILEEDEGVTRLTVEMYGMEPGQRRYEDFVHGQPYIMSGLKTLLETGKSLGTA